MCNDSNRGGKVLRHSRMLALSSLPCIDVSVRAACDRNSSRHIDSYVAEIGISKKELRVCG